MDSLQRSWGNHLFAENSLTSKLSEKAPISHGVYTKQKCKGSVDVIFNIPKWCVDAIFFCLLHIRLYKTPHACEVKNVVGRVMKSCFCLCRMFRSLVYLFILKNNAMLSDNIYLKIPLTIAVSTSTSLSLTLIPGIHQLTHHH